MLAWETKEAESEVGREMSQQFLNEKLSMEIDTH